MTASRIPADLSGLPILENVHEPLCRAVDLGGDHEGEAATYDHCSELLENIEQAIDLAKGNDDQNLAADLTYAAIYLHGLGDAWNATRLEVYSAWAAGQKPPQLYACPRCGCTDVQWTSWVDANTGALSDDDAPTDYGFCPQCETNGYDGSMKQSDFVLVDKAQPFTKETT